MAKISQPQQITVTVDDDTVGLRLDKVLSLHSQIESRSKAAALIDGGHVSLGRKKVKASQITKLGESYSVEIPAPIPTDLQPYDFKLEVVFEDDHVLVINKPAGLVVHPAAGHAQDTLVNALISRGTVLSAGGNQQRPGVVHRLDKDTSGLLVLAKTESAHRHLARQFKDRTIHRIYWALVLGKPPKPKGRILSYLKRHPKDRKRFASEKVQPGHEPTGKFAVTHYETVKTAQGKISLLNCKLETGRTHQIRIHLSEQNTPIIGDYLYGSGSKAKAYGLKRIGLHAAELGFIHPHSEKPLLFKAPWPDDLTELVREVFGEL